MSSALKTRNAIAKNARSPELQRLIKALDQVSKDLPRILREEKAVAFARFETVDAFEAHMRQISVIPAHLEELSVTLGRSLQVAGATDHLSRIFRSLYNARAVNPAPGAVDPGAPVFGAPDSEDGIRVEPVTVRIPAGPAPVSAPVSASKSPPLMAAQTGLPPTPSVGPATDQAASAPQVDPGTGDLVARPPAGPAFRPIDLNLHRVRDRIVPGGTVCGRSMVESSRVRLVTARATGEGPWRFQLRKGSLEWAVAAEGVRGVVALICGDRGYIEVHPDALLRRGESHLMRSTKGNAILRPSVAVFGAEAILHPGAMARTRPGDTTKHVFVEF